MTVAEPILTGIKNARGQVNVTRALNVTILKCRKVKLVRLRPPVKTTVYTTLPPGKGSVPGLGNATHVTFVQILIHLIICQILPSPLVKIIVMYITSDGLRSANGLASAMRALNVLIKISTQRQIAFLCVIVGHDLHGIESVIGRINVTAVKNAYPLMWYRNVGPTVQRTMPIGP
mmetsp:Transcript_13782/g.17321  ORF Transcript_13782/g.17321 Transcript_13782/m.17321 type:complete len:175 (-) Transcript_13782:389-913(-)